MVYRDDTDALESRLVALDGELADRTRERDEVARMLDDARGRAEEARVLADRAAGGPARRRRALVIAIGATLALIGAVVALRARAARSDEQLEIVFHRMSMFADEMCRCTDAACAQRVSDEMTRWATDTQNHWPDPPKHDLSFEKRSADIGMRLSACMGKALTQGTEVRGYQSQGGGE